MLKRINKKVLRTAQMICLLQALSFQEDDDLYKSDDYIALIFLPFFFKMILKVSFLRKQFKKIFFNSGMYQYIIGRTEVIDDFFDKFAKDIEQILIFGAGFDSRAIRFKDYLKVDLLYQNRRSNYGAKRKKKI
jgi:O-methyltransferase involved in polyketide biosynthesis